MVAVLNLTANGYILTFSPWRVLSNDSLCFGEMGTLPFPRHGPTITFVPVLCVAVTGRLNVGGIYRYFAEGSLMWSRLRNGGQDKGKIAVEPVIVLPSVPFGAYTGVLALQVPIST